MLLDYAWLATWTPITPRSRGIASHILDLDARIERPNADIAAASDPFDDQITIIMSLAGVEKASAEVIVAEIGGDISKFATPGQLCAWASRAPGNNEFGGQLRSAPTRKGSHPRQVAERFPAAHIS